MHLLKIAILLPLGCCILASCSSVKNGFATARSATTDTIANVRTKAFGGDNKLQLTDAKPDQFLPQNTGAESIRKNPVIARKEQRQRLLAKNERQSRKQQNFSAASDISLADLPPLPEYVEGGDQTYTGILPELQTDPRLPTVDILGETPELPPLALPKETNSAE